MEQREFFLADYIVFAITIAASIGIGVFYAFAGGRQKTTSEFHLGNRQMSILPVAISLLVSFESSIMMLGTPAETYVYGIQNIMAEFGWFVTNLLAIKIWVPLIHPLKITSSYEYLGLRFQSKNVRLLGTVLGMINNALYLGVVLFGPAIALEAVMGFSQFASMIIVALAAIVYTSMGGFKAVVWADVFQSFIMIGGMMAILIKGTIVSGGAKNAWNIANDNGRLNFFVWDTDITRRHTFWNLFLGSIIRRTALIFNQSTVQRICATPTLKGAKRVMMIVSPAYLICTALACCEGIVAYSYYHTLGCDPLKSKRISNPNQIIPYMVMDIFYGCLECPVFLWRHYSAHHSDYQVTLSDELYKKNSKSERWELLSNVPTLSSGLSSLSAVFWQDIVKPHTKPMSEFKATVISKIAVVFFGFVTLAVALLVSLIGGPLTQIALTVLSACGGPLTGLFLLGSLCPWANSKGAFVGVSVGVALVVWIATGQYLSPNVRKAVQLPSAPVDQCFINDVNVTSMYNMTSPLYTMSYKNEITTEMLTTTPGVDRYKIPSGIDYFYSISYLWFSIIGNFSVIIIGSIVSLLTGPTTPQQSNPMYLVCIVDELFFFLPKRLRTFLKFGYNYDKPEVDETDRPPYNATIVVDGPENNEKKNGQLNNSNECILAEHRRSSNSVNELSNDHSKVSVPLLSDEKHHDECIALHEVKK